MKKCCLILLILFLICHIVSCKSDDNNEISEEQLIEIIEMDTGNVLRQITDTAMIREYTEKSEPEKWIEINLIPKDVVKLYAFTNYAKVSDKIYLKDGKTWISEYQEILYCNRDGFYLKEIDLNDSKMQTYTYRIPDSAGDYLISLHDGNWEIKDRNDIFALWKVDDTSSYDIVKDIEQSGSDEAYEAESEIYDVDGVANASLKQKIVKMDIYGKILFFITDLKEITEFYNNLSENQWTEIEKVPEDNEEICSIIFYQNDRKTRNKDMIETKRIILYKKNNEYYVSAVIPGNSGNEDMIICSKIPFNIGKYIEDWQ